MLIEKIKLNDNAELTAYIADDTGYKRDGLLVIPGGGYNCVCKEREGEPVALAFLGKGINAFVLNKYSVGENAEFPKPLIDASLAMKHIKDNADKYNIDKERVFACGFSAGGHLCANLGIMWNLDAIYEKIDMERGYNKPKGIIPCYPVVSGITPTHIGSFQNLSGKEKPTLTELEALSVETFVDENSSPAFIMHTANDQVVPVDNALVLAAAYNKAKVPFALHIFPDAPHGVALGNEITECGNKEYVKPDIEKWVDMALYWMKGVKKMQTHVILRWPEGRIKALTLSYDDAQNFDKRMIEIMNKYGIKGTFNLNSKESDIGNEKRVQPDEYKEVYKGHEIALHGKFHVSGKLVPCGTFAYDMIENRKDLEEITGEIISGMAYANGSFDETTKEILRDCGVKYGRTTKATRNFEIPEDWLELNPTCHHNSEKFLELTDEFLSLEEGLNWRAFTAKLFYLWGHSYEFDRNNNWELLENFCEKMGNRDDIWYATNVEIYDYVKAFNKLEFNLDLTQVYNPTSTDVWFKTPAGVYKVGAGERMEF